MSVRSDEDYDSIDQTSESDVLESDVKEPEPIDVDTIPDKLKDAMESMSDKKKTTREAALQTLLALLQRHHCDEALEGHVFELFDILLRCLRKGAVLERELCLHILSVVLLTRSSMDMLDTWDVYLRQLSSDPAAGSSVNESAVQALVLLYFLLDIDQHKVLETCDFVMKLLHDKRYRTGPIMRSWSFLMSTLTTSQAAHVYSTEFEYLHRCIDEEALEMKMAAGEALALLYEKCRGGDTDMESLESVVDVSGLQSRVKELSRQTTKHVAKKERATQKSSFRQISDTILEEVTPVSTLKLQVGQVQFTGWSDITRLNMFRSSLQSGLPHHILHNPLLSDVFSYDPAELSEHTVARGGLQSQHERDTIKKAQKQQRSSERAAKEADRRV